MGRRNQHYVKNIVIYDIKGNVVQRHELDETGRLIHRQPDILFSRPPLQPPVMQRGSPIPMPQISMQIPQNDLQRKQELLRNYPITPKMRSKPLSLFEGLFSFPKFKPAKLDDNIYNVFGYQHSIQPSCF
ncbi:hypothetical protein GPJ56_010378 [Histomonas meleagridis]|uniref:uncharacterized protein n=1 Tax=Histomonas meleagridis TaxID=135588 RepID=UPI003559416F|nr:hypothetical protein GPJ56_010378 [Histomonas meleagridis]KAH0806617.1 hypothetical protein GO595_000604 [Histomonas meleagridis]